MIQTLPVKHLFELPAGVIYLDGNSLGPLPKAVPARVAATVEKEWGEHLITGWNVDDWIGQPLSVADKLGRLIGAGPGTTVLGDTLSVKVWQALSAALQMRPDRRTILSDSGNFPSDLYMAQGLVRHLDRGHDLRIVASDEVAAAITTDVAAVMLTQVDYRTGRMHDMEALTKAAHAAGAVMIWDLAHSAGALPVDVTACQAEFAVGCTYKYLNGGPGAPAFIYARPDVVEAVAPSLAGWLGHDAPFAFERDYRPSRSIERFRIGTPPVLQVAALDAALSVWEGITMQDVRAASIALSERFIAGVEARVPELRLASPRDPANRGNQVSFGFEHGYAAMQALIARGVIGDYRAPDIMRFGFAPLYLDAQDVDTAVDHLARIIHNRLWDNPAYQATNRVT